MNLIKVGRAVSKYGKKTISLSDDNDDIKTYEHIVSKDEKLEYIPNSETRDVIYCCGPSGSGKSYYIASYCEKYHNLHKRNKVYLFSECTEDPVFDKKKYIDRILIDDELLEDKIEWNEFEDCLCIFDDIDALSGKYKKYITELKNKLLKNSRKNNVSVIVSNHNCTDGHDTKSTLNESNVIVFFMLNYNRGIKYLLESYIGMDKKGIEKLRKLKTRSITYIKSYPNLLLSDYEVGTKIFYNS